MALTSTGQQTKRPAWAWTLEERIALRTDPVAARERIRVNLAAAGRTTGSNTASSERRPIADQFDGKHHPELFLPHQVFDQLVKLAFDSNARMGQAIRADLMPDLKSHGLPADFWLRLESIAAAYLSDYRALKELQARATQQPTQQGRRVEQELALKHQDICRDRAAALDTARTEFGRERFDRFLYEVIVVNMFSVTDKLPEPELLREAERGCR